MTKLIQWTILTFIFEVVVSKAFATIDLPHLLEIFAFGFMILTKALHLFFSFFIFLKILYFLSSLMKAFFSEINAEPLQLLT